MAKVKRFTYTKDPEQWADIHTRPTWGQLAQISDIQDDLETPGSVRTVKAILVLVAAWRAVDEDGKELPLTVEGMMAADGALISAIGKDASDVMTVTLPKK